MKKLFILLAVVAGLSSCATPGPQYSEFGTVTSYSDYDMFITEATSLNFNYEPLGSVSAYVESGYANGIVKRANFVSATPDDAIRVLTEKARQIGAFGIMNVKIQVSVIANPHYTGNNNILNMQEYAFLRTYKASGMAIKW